MLMIRPERVRLDPVPEGRGTLPATVESSVFQGAIVRVALRLVDGSSLIAHLAAADGAAAVPGQAVALHWDPDAARVLPGESA